MPSSLIARDHTGSMPNKAMMPMVHGRPDYQLADALKKVSPQAQAKAKATRDRLRGDVSQFDVFADDERHQGRRPFGDTPGTGVWRSMLTEQYSKKLRQGPAASGFPTTSIAR